MSTDPPLDDTRLNVALFAVKNFLKLGPSFDDIREFEGTPSGLFGRATPRLLRHG